MTQGKNFAIALFLGFYWYAGLVLAQSAEPGDLFEATGIKVDVEAENPVKAKQAGLAVGRRAALNEIMMRLVPNQYHSAFPDLADREIDRFIETFSVLSEKSSATRYIARLSFQLTGADVRRLLKSKQIPFSESRAKMILVAPVLKRSSGPVLFEEDNAWLNAWQAREGDGNGLVPVMLPLGDLLDIAALPGAAAVRGDRQRIAEIAKRHGVERVLIAIADEPVGGSPSRVNVNAILYETGRQINYEITIRGSGNSVLADLYSRGAAALVDSLNEDWKAATVQSFESGDVLRVDVQTANQSDWAFVRRQLAAEQRLSSTRLLTMNRNGAVMELDYSGGLEALKLALGQRDLILRESDDGSWSLTPNPSR